MVGHDVDDNVLQDALLDLTADARIAADRLLEQLAAAVKPKEEPVRVPLQQAAPALVSTNASGAPGGDLR